MNPGGSALFVVGLLGVCGGCGDGTSTQSQEPPADPTVLAAVETGRDLFFGRAACSACHKVGAEGNMVVGPNLGVGDGMTAPVVSRAAERRPALSPVEYVIESMIDPDAVVVESYARSVMKSLDEMPQEVSDDELVALAAFVVAQAEPQRLSPQDLERAAAAIPAARESRERRRKRTNP